MKPIILLADHERSIPRACKMFLEEQGYMVLLAEDGEEVVDVRWSWKVLQNEANRSWPIRLRLSCD